MISQPYPNLAATSAFCSVSTYRSRDLALTKSPSTVRDGIGAHDLKALKALYNVIPMYYDIRILCYPKLMSVKEITYHLLH